MAMTGFICHDKYLIQTKNMSDEQLGRLFRACMRYHADRIEPELDGMEGMAFDFIREDIDAAEKAYNTKCETNRRNRIGVTYNEPFQPLTVVNERQETSTTDANINKIKDNKNIIKEKEKEKEREMTRRFTPPSLEEVEEYCRERNNGVDPQRFIDFYESKGWKVGNQPMKSWKACVRTWEGRDRPNNTGSKPVRKLIEQQYTQRSYLNTPETPEEILRRLKAEEVVVNKKDIQEEVRADENGVQDEQPGSDVQSGTEQAV